MVDSEATIRRTLGARDGGERDDAMRGRRDLLQKKSGRGGDA
jgi:hypothetical protein